MTDTIPVILESRAKDMAYSEGFEAFIDTDPDGTEEFSTTEFKQSAHWLDEIKPRLRALAGFADSGSGTYKESREVVLLPQNSEDDVPAMGDVVSAHTVLNALIDEFDRGANMAADHAFGGDDDGR